MDFHTGIENGDYKVEFIDIGEGLDGDYNPEDPTDVPLLRFDSYVKVDGEWEPVEDGSYCTRVSAYANKATLDALATIIVNGLVEVTGGGYSPKRYLESMSWITEEDANVTA